MKRGLQLFIDSEDLEGGVKNLGEKNGFRNSFHREELGPKNMY